MTTDTASAPAPAPLPLLVLGQGTDLHTERGVECPGDLPPASDPGLVERARAAKAALGDRVFVLGHHYQRNEVIEFADVTGDSFKARPRRRRPARRALHRLLRRALHGRVRRHPHERRADRDPARPRSGLLDGRHGRHRPGRGLLGAGDRGRRRRRDDPRHLHELLRRDQGLHRPARRHHLHEPNARTALDWAFEQVGGVGLDGTGTGKVLFLPDQHLGRNTAVREPASRSTTASSGTRTARTAA